MNAADKDRLWAELDVLGEDQVREKLGLGHYGDRRKGGVEEWLRQKDQGRLDERDRSNYLAHERPPLVLVIWCGLANYPPDATYNQFHAGHP